MKTKAMVFAVLFLFSMNSNAEIAVGDTFVLWAGFSNFLGMSGGRVEGTEVLDSSLVKGDTSVYFFSCIRTIVYQFWEGTPQRLPGLSTQSKMTILNKTPSTIASSSVRFRNAAWIIGEKSDFLFYPALKNASPYWSIPINTTDSAFLSSDYYTVRVSDTTGIKWCRDPSDDHLFNGKFLQFNDRFDTIGKYDPDSLKYSSFRGPPSWRAIGGYMSGDINPFHVLYVATSSTIPLLQGDSIEPGCYSNQITRSEEHTSELQSR
jgi:hypothetical protein